MSSQPHAHVRVIKAGEKAKNPPSLPPDKTVLSKGVPSSGVKKTSQRMVHPHPVDTHAEQSQQARSRHAAPVETIPQSQQLHEMRQELQNMKMAYHRLLSDHKLVLTDMKMLRAAQKESADLGAQARHEARSLQVANTRLEEAYEAVKAECRMHKDEFARAESYTQHLLRELTLAKEARTRAELAEGRLQVQLRELQRSSTIPISSTAANTAVNTPKRTDGEGAYATPGCANLMHSIFAVQLAKAAPLYSPDQIREDIAQLAVEAERLAHADDTLGKQAVELIGEKTRLLELIEQREALLRDLHGNVEQLMGHMETAVAERDAVHEAVCQVSELLETVKRARTALAASQSMRSAGSADHRSRTSGASGSAHIHDHLKLVLDISGPMDDAAQHAAQSSKAPSNTSPASDLMRALVKEPFDSAEQLAASTHGSQAQEAVAVRHSMTGSGAGRPSMTGSGTGRHSLTGSGRTFAQQKEEPRSISEQSYCSSSQAGRSQQFGGVLTGAKGSSAHWGAPSSFMRSNTSESSTGLSDLVRNEAS